MCSGEEKTEMTERFIYSDVTVYRCSVRVAKTAKVYVERCKYCRERF